MENSFSNLIDSASSILILIPRNPKLDEVASGLALYLALKESKHAAVSCTSPMTVEFNRLIGVNKVTAEVGSKNMVIRFINYRASDIERVSYDIENQEFKLSVIPKPSFESPKKEQVAINYSGVEADSIILIGGNKDSDFTNLSSKEFAGAKLIHIGKRNIDVSSDFQVMSFARPSSSVSEIVYDLFNEGGYKVDSDIATNLLAGIEVETQGFSSDEASAETFSAVANLLKSGGARMPSEIISANIPNKKPGQEILDRSQQPQEVQSAKAPKDWLEPKVYKGSDIS